MTRVALIHRFVEYCGRALERSTRWTGRRHLQRPIQRTAEALCRRCLRLRRARVFPNPSGGTRPGLSPVTRAASTRSTSPPIGGSRLPPHARKVVWSIQGGRALGARSLSELHLRGRRDLEPQSLADAAPAPEARQAERRRADRRRSGMKPESIAQAAERLREEAPGRRQGAQDTVAGGAPTFSRAS